MARRGGYNDYFEALAVRESSDNYQLVSSLGYLGRYQMGELSLAEIGYYAGDGTSAQDYVGRWTGRDGINSVADFLNSPRVQDSAAREYTAWNWQTLTQYGFNVYAGQTLNGQAMSLSGILGATWLVGFSGMRDFLESGGTNAAVDGFGTSMLEYIELFNGFGTPVAFRTDLQRANEINGGSGRDVLRGLSGNDTLDGRGGVDTAVFRGDFAEYRIERAGDAVVTVSQTGGNGRDGTDRLINIEFARFDDRTVSLTGSLDRRRPDRDPDRDQDPDRNPDPDPGRGDTIVGTSAGERLAGTGAADAIRARGGRDTVDGRTGDDKVSGGSRNDHLDGSAGDDSIRGDVGHDKGLGGGGDDLLVGGAGRDTLNGEAGDDRVFGRGANDDLHGGPGRDRLVGDGGHDELSGGRGKDTLVGGWGRDTLSGGQDGDVFVFDGSAGRDVVTGLGAGDRLDFSAVAGVRSVDDVRVFDGPGASVLLRAGDAAVIIENTRVQDVTDDLFIV
ncbi:MAG: calcium-binding protein [Pseudomonadota bacterium]